MPEGDTLFRTAEVLRRSLLGERVSAARARPGGAHLERVVGSQIIEVRSQGKHLLIGFHDGLTLHSHLGMHGSWHRYGVEERWRRHPYAAVAELWTPRAVAVCFGAPVVELLETRALSIHPVLARLGPDLLAPAPDLAAAVVRLQTPARVTRSVAEALLDQSAVAGIGNVVRSEVLHVAGVDPWLPVGDVPAAELQAILGTAADLLRANVGGGARVTTASPGRGPLDRSMTRQRLWVYGRAGRPCRRCGTLIRVGRIGAPSRSIYWCPTCQAARPGAGAGVT